MHKHCILGVIAICVLIAAITILLGKSDSQHKKPSSAAYQSSHVENKKPDLILPVNIKLY